MDQDKYTNSTDQGSNQSGNPESHMDSSTQPILYSTPVAPQEPPAVESIQTETRSAQTESHPARRIVGVLFGAVEIVFGLRLILKLFGANAGNAVIKALYDFTGFFVRLFEGIFSRVTINEASGAVFEPATLITIVVIALIALVVLKLMKPRTGSRVVKTNYSGPAGQSGQQK